MLLSLISFCLVMWFGITVAIRFEFGGFLKLIFRSLDGMVYFDIIYLKARVNIERLSISNVYCFFRF